MDINTTADALQSLVNEHEVKRATVLNDTSRSKEWQLQKLSELDAIYAQKAESELGKAWGEFAPAQDNAWEQQGGVVWEELENAQQMLETAKEKAAGVTIDSNAIERLRAIVGSAAGDPDAVSSYLQNKATRAEKLAAQEYLAGMVDRSQRIGQTGMKWGRLFSQLERDRDARMTTADVQAAQARIDGLVTQLATVSNATQAVVGRFAAQSGLVGAYGVGHQRKVDVAPDGTVTVAYVKLPVRGLTRSPEATRERIYGRGMQDSPLFTKQG